MIQVSTTKKSESAIQAEIYKWFNNTYCLLHHTPRHCIFAVPNQNQHRLVNIGVRAGIPDMIVIISGKFYFFEIKDDTGRQSPAQKEFELYCSQNFIPYFLVKTLTEFQTICSSLI